MMGDSCSIIGTRETDLAQVSDALDNENWDSCNLYGA
jgi:hypothetical protein